MFVSALHSTLIYANYAKNKFFPRIRQEVKAIKAKNLALKLISQGLGRPCAMRVWRIKLRNGPLKKYLPGL